jgi:hypothetical protein
MHYPGWQAHEKHVQDLLELDSTPGSGNQFYAPGDAVDNRHQQQSSFAVLADCKYTEKGSFSVNHHFMAQQTDRATEAGKRFVMPIRFFHRGARHPDDYVVLGLDDFAELLTKARTLDDLMRMSAPGLRG